MLKPYQGTTGDPGAKSYLGFGPVRHFCLPLFFAGSFNEGMGGIIAEPPRAPYVFIHEFIGFIRACSRD